MEKVKLIDLIRRPCIETNQGLTDFSDVEMVSHCGDVYLNQPKNSNSFGLTFHRRFNQLTVQDNSNGSYFVIECTNNKIIS